MSGGDHRRFLANYTPEELHVAAEFLSTWMPFISTGLCTNCISTLTRRIKSLRNSEVDNNSSSLSNRKPSLAVRTPDNTEWGQINEQHEYFCTSSFGSGKRAAIDINDKFDTNSLGSWKGAADINDSADTTSLGSWGNGTNNGKKAMINFSMNTTRLLPSGVRDKMSWADMAQEDQQLEGDEESEVSEREDSGVVNSRQKTKLSREQRECIRFNNVNRKKDFICFERVNGKLVNILQGLELHTGVFSAVEQKRIVDSVYNLQEMGRRGELKARTFTAPAKWMRGKGRVTIQFGCCYNYAKDKNGNLPGILQSENVDPIPRLLKVMIRRLVKWHVLPPSCVPDSCIVNIYDEGDCIPPHIDNHDFVRPFCTVSFLSECNILFGSNLSTIAAGEFSGPIAIPLPIGSVLVLNGNGADVAKHCVPAVPTKRISITFRKMDESKRPYEFVPEPDLQGLEPLLFETKGSNIKTPQRSIVSKSNSSSSVVKTLSYGTDNSDRGLLSRLNPVYPPVRQENRRENNRGRFRGSFGRGRRYLDPHSSLQIQTESFDRRKVRVNLNVDDTYIVR